MNIKDVDRNQLSPMMRHYVELKDKYPDVILLYRLGDFYEMFFEDAITISHDLELTLTGRSAGLEERVPMCGIPYHAASVYIDKIQRQTESGILSRNKQHQTDRKNGQQLKQPLCLVELQGFQLK